MEYGSDARLPNAGRRHFLKQAGAAALGGLLFGGKALASATHAMPSAEATPDFNPDIELELAAVVDEVSLLPGKPTSVWRFTSTMQPLASTTTIASGAASSSCANSASSGLP